MDVSAAVRTRRPTPRTETLKRIIDLKGQGGQQSYSQGITCEKPYEKAIDVRCEDVTIFAAFALLKKAFYEPFPECYSRSVSIRWYRN